LADLKITQLPSLTSLDATDPIPVADLSATETRKITAKNFVQQGVALIDNNSIPANKITYPLTAAQVVTASLADSAVTAAKIAADAVGSSAIAANAVGASELADASVDTAALQDASVTSAKIGSDVIVAGNIAANAIGSSELADLSVDAAALQSNSVLTSKINALAVTNDKLAGSITGDKLTDSTITSTQLATNSVTNVELGDASVDTAAVVDFAITDAKVASNISGSKITDDTLTAAKIPTSALDRGLSRVGTAIGITNAPSGGASTRSGISYDSQGLITATQALAAADLPLSSASAVGGVSVPSAGGLAVDNLGAISINNTIAAATINGITYSAKGIITSTTALVGSDLPVATKTAIGAISVPSASSPLQVDGAGVLSLATSGISAGTYTKVTVASTGIVTAGSSLAASDIPALDATKISSGTFGSAQIASSSIQMAKLADESLGFIQEAQPDITNLPKGVFWLQESTSEYKIFNGNSWYSVGLSGTTGDNLRFSGTVNASNGQIVSLTEFGTSGGFTVGSQINTANAGLVGSYFLVVTAGSSINVVSGVSFDVGDWALCSKDDTWIRVDLAGGGGGSGATSLDGLSDVSITSAATGNLLQYQSGGNWTNVSLISGGTY